MTFNIHHSKFIMITMDTSMVISFRNISDKIFLKNLFGIDCSIMVMKGDANQI